MKWPIKVKAPDWRDIGIVAQEIPVVLDALGAVAAVLATEDEEPMDPFVKTFRLYEDACDVLETLSTFDPDTEKVPSLSSDQITTSGILLGCWFNPTTSTDAANSNQRLYQDLASFLTLTGVPAKIEHTTKGNYNDTASLIAPVVFHKPGTPAAPTVSHNFRLQNVDGDCIIQAKNACYKLPLGNNKASTTAWHAGLQVRVTMKKEFHQAQLGKLPKKAIVPTPTTSTDDLIFSSTIQVDFADSSAAEDAGPKIPDFVQKNAGYIVSMTSVIGLRLTLKVQGPPGAWPADIEATFCKAVADFVHVGGGGARVMPSIKVLVDDLV